MSAIFGILRFDGEPVAARDLERMGATMATRGPDGRVTFVDGPVGLGHALMRITREDAFDDQPLHDRDAGLVLVADLRLDNRDDLAGTLGIAGDELATMPDSTLLLHAYRRWGEGCAAHLIGDFAFAVWDVRARRLVLGRDPMGQRQIHYHRGEDGFVFATEITALWAVPGVPRRLEGAWLGQLAYRVRRPAAGGTPFDAILGIPGGTVMTVEAGGVIRSHRYWEPRADPRHLDRPDAYYVAAYRAILGEAVACRVRRLTGKPGLLLSGGFDSAAVAGLAGPALAGGTMVAAASVSCRDPGDAGARKWVALCARDMPHLDVRYVTGADADLLGGLEAAFREGEGPAGLHHDIERAMLATLAGAGVRLVMDGQGGDYTLNPRGHHALARLAAGLRFRRLWRELVAHRRVTGESWRRILTGRLCRPLVPDFVIAIWTAARQLFRPGDPVIALDPALVKRLRAARVVGRDDLRRGDGAVFDRRDPLGDLLRRVAGAHSAGGASRAAAHGLELTRPFHDRRVVELALAIPAHLHVRDGRNRYLACVALRDVYPAEFQRRPRGNDSLRPDFARAAELARDALLAETDRLQDSSVAAHFDLHRVRDLIAGAGPGDSTGRTEAAMELAVRTLLMARYLEWFGRANR